MSNPRYFVLITGTKQNSGGAFYSLTKFLGILTLLASDHKRSNA